MIAELFDENTELWYVGRMVEFIKQDGFSDKIKIFNTIDDLVNQMQ
jgi:hypothetical protein